MIFELKAIMFCLQYLNRFQAGESADTVLGMNHKITVNAVLQRTLAWQFL